MQGIKVESKRILLIKMFMYCLFIVFAYWNIRYMYMHLNTEVSFEIVYMHQINIEKTVLPRQFYYGYELSILRPATLAALLDAFLKNAILSYAVSLNISMLVVLVSVHYMLKSIGLSEEAIYIANIVLLSLSSWDTLYCMCFFNGYYSFYIITICLFVGYYNYILTDKGYSIFPVVFFIITSFIFGLMGVRMLIMFYLPMFVFTGWNLKAELYEGKLSDSSKKGLFIVTTALLSTLAGFLTFNLYVKKKYVFGAIPSDMRFISSSSIGERLLTSLEAILENAGMKGNIQILSWPGVAYGISFLILCVVIAYICYSFRKNKRKEILSIFIICLLITAIVLSLVEWQIISRYYIVYSLLAAVCLSCIYDDIRYKNMIMLFLLILSVINISGSIYPRITQTAEKNERSVVELCENNGYYNGFGVYCDGEYCGLPIGPLSNFDINLSYVKYDASINSIERLLSTSSQIPYHINTPSFIMFNLSSYQKHEEELNKNDLIKSSIYSKEIEPYIIFFYAGNPFFDGNTN